MDEHEDMYVTEVEKYMRLMAIVHLFR